MPVDIYSIALFLVMVLSAGTAILSKKVPVRLFAFVAICAVCILFINLYLWSTIRYSRLANQGDPAAQRNLGQAMMHYRNGARFDPKRGLMLLTKAAEAGDLGAQIILASHYLTGISAPVDTNKAKYWLEKALATEHQELLMLRKLANEAYTRSLEESPEYQIALRYARGKNWDN